MFVREEKVPMTKEEIRAIVISKLRLKRGQSFLDIGCGTGSITVEAGMIVKGGKIIAIDKDEKAVRLTKENVERSGIKNVEVIHCAAPECLKEMGGFDRVFVGGGSEKLEEILSQVKGRRIVVDAIQIESAYKAISTMERLGFKDIDVTQVIVSKGLRTSTGTAMISRNPVIIVSGDSP
ncbi:MULTISPECIES: precorrin-6Y C5,15-methyltransferase (decarboxylating) subunit CbiT [Acidianus]|nr:MULTISPECIES: precorrin-6Y C5,15-methyltransferase (decarboxylating) subunit CbiT [Acidianus]NON63239.1 precorrin-6Y C5,15-methyltransferase (decarboxylating) subunit CbiT [Acidianus sp. RZ1]